MGARTSLLVLALLIGLPGLVSAQEIFSEDFEGGSLRPWSDVSAPLPPWLDYLSLFRDLADLPHPWLNYPWAHGFHC